MLFIKPVVSFIHVLDSGKLSVSLGGLFRKTNTTKTSFPAKASTTVKLPLTLIILITSLVLAGVVVANKEVCKTGLL